MEKPRLEGSFVALITPFNQDGSVDYAGFRTWIDFHHEHGTSALLIMGSTGEVSLLSWVERRRIIHETVKYKKPGMPLYLRLHRQQHRVDHRSDPLRGA